MEPNRRSFLKSSFMAGTALALPRVAHAYSPATTAAAGSDFVELAEPAETAAAAQAVEAHVNGFTRGAGLYPGAPDEYAGPTLVPDTSGAYRNLALLRPAFHSSSYDYNLTAQLLTDGIIDTELPTWVATVVNGRILPKPDRDLPLNHAPEVPLALVGSTPSVEIHLGGGATLPHIDRLGLFVVIPDAGDPRSRHFVAAVSDDGRQWRPVGNAVGGKPLDPTTWAPGLVQGTLLLAPSLPFAQAVESRFYRVDFSQTADSGTAIATVGLGWQLGQVEFYRGTERVNLGGPYHFTSAWKGAGLAEEWVYVDLGGRFSFDRVALHWIARAAEGRLQVSDDAHSWHDLRVLPNPSGNDPVDDIRLSPSGQGRYVRVLMTRPATEHGYILSEFEVFGRGGFTVQAKPAPAARSDGRLDLRGGRWRLLRAETALPSSISDTSHPEDPSPLTGETLSVPGYHDLFWLPATVPGTVLTSYLNVGAIPDPNFGQNQLYVSDSFFYADFWYRTEFAAPPVKPGQIQWLNLDGINWKAEVYLNGALLGRIDGGFLRGHFDITAHVHAGKANALAIRIRKNDTPGSCKQKTLEVASKNGGGLGADNPTFHASVGWDWIPTIRGRNTGIWADVYLTTTGTVTLADPLITSTFPTGGSGSQAPAYADISLGVVAVNHAAKPFRGTLRGRFGSLTFEQRVSLAAGEQQTIRFSPATHPELRLSNPQLWWPTGYGEPHLYDVEFSIETGRPGTRSLALDRVQTKAGIRQMTATEDGGVLRLFINGRRFIARGGNWGFSESMLRYRAREYDAAVRYHRDMHFNMIRNWVGQIGDDALYEACDRYGIVVWQDFWLANPWDGPIPDNNAMFLANARDLVGRIRRHASVGLYCGRNEWFPPPQLEQGLRALLAELHPDIHYIGSSADGPVSGHGPYRALTAPEYFRLADTKLHSEIGAPAIPPMDSVRAMMSPAALWPQGLDWGLHDFTLDGAQGGAAFETLIAENYGGAANAEEWVTLGEIASFEAYRAMMEAQSRFRMGVLLWMSHPCWPSFVWQTYDFYFAPTAAYFACKLGAEPLHIQWNSFADTIEVVNYSAGDVRGLLAEVELINLDGHSMGKQSAPLASTEDSVSTPITLAYPAGLSAVHLLRLTLTQTGTVSGAQNGNQTGAQNNVQNDIQNGVSTGIVRSRNTYLRGTAQGDYRAIRTLPPAQVRAQTKAERHGDRWQLTTILENASAIPALFVRLTAVGATTGERIVPALYEDNYLALMPGEVRTLLTEVAHADTRGETPALRVEGFNLGQG